MLKKIGFLLLAAAVFVAAYDAALGAYLVVVDGISLAAAAFFGFFNLVGVGVLLPEGV